MTFPLQYSPYEQQKTKHKKTYKKSKKVADLLAAMDDDNDGLADYKPMQYPAYPQKPEPVGRLKEKQPQKQKVEEDTAVGIENFAQLNNTEDSPPNQEYYRQYVPYYTNVENAAQMTKGRDELLEKLNYMIHLLEEQQEDKTANITEELILYLFLGIFVIFIVDSFARAGKYKR